MGVTSPDNIYVHDGSAPASIVTESQTQGASIQAALNKRERYDFVWANSAERTAQTGMVQGSRGYQVDTKSEYIYDNSTWRLALSHAEFTSQITLANGGPNLLGTFTLDATKTTDTTFISPSTSGILIINNPGVYAVSTVTAMYNPFPTVAAATGRTFLDLSFTLSAADLQRVSIVVGEDRGSLSSPNVRSTIASQNLYFEIFKNTTANADVRTRVRITRIG